MPRAHAPLWMAGPTRFAGLSRARAVLVLVAFVALAIASLATRTPPLARAASPHTSQSSDLMLYESVIDGLRAGGDYYQLTADALRAGDYPLRPFVTFRLPVHSVVQAFLPAPATRSLLFLLVAAVIVAWWVRLVPLLARPAPRIAATILLAGGLIAFVQSELIGFHEIWAAPLVALSLALRAPGRWGEAVALGLIAMLVRETAALYVLVMAGLAWRDGARGEAVAWGATLAVFAVVLGLHGHAVAQVTGPLDPASPGWTGRLGPGFLIESVARSTALSALSPYVALPVGLLALAGWSAPTDPLLRRAGATIAAYALVIALFARADTFYWALMAAPLFLVGLTFVPDAARDLAHAILDRPRVRVQRITR